MDTTDPLSNTPSNYRDEGMRFHLPTYMLADLNGDYGFGLAYTLAMNTQLEEQFRLLNNKQRAAMRGYLKFIENEPEYEYEREHITNALTNYWSM